MKTAEQLLQSLDFEISDQDYDHKTYQKEGCSIHVTNGARAEDREVFFITDKGESCYLPYCYFSLLGALIHYRIIRCDELPPKLKAPIGNRKAI